MSKEGLKKLNKELLNYLRETGIENAFYYEPFFDYYWEQNDKIGICNLEPYDNGLGINLQGLKLVDDKVIVDYWYKSQTIQRTLKMFQLITRKIETETDVTESDVTACDNSQIDKVIEQDLGCALYFNFRLTVGKQVNENTSDIFDFYSDPFYCEYIRNFIKESEIKMLILTGSTGCDLINKIYPELHLEFKGEPKKSNNVIFCSAQHPASRNYSNKEMADNINNFFDYYWKEN